MTYGSEIEVIVRGPMQGWRGAITGFTRRGEVVVTFQEGLTRVAVPFHPQEVAELVS